MKTSIRIAIAGAALMTVPMAFGDVAFNDYGSYFGYNTSVGYTIGGSTSNVGSVAAALTFNSLATGTLLDVILPVGLVTGSDTIDVSLCTDAAGTIGSTMQTWTMNTDGAFGGNYPSSLLAGNGVTSLTSGTAYWLVVMPTNPSSNIWAAWNLNSTGATGTIGGWNGTSWSYFSGQTLGTAKVDVNPPAVPEPLSMSALAIGVVGLVRRRRAR